MKYEYNNTLEIELEFVPRFKSNSLVYKDWSSLVTT